MNNLSATNFPGQARVHVALTVTDLMQSRRFYETLLGVSPSKERPGYVKFEPQDPSVNLTLNQVDVPAHHRPTANEPPSNQRPVSHFGIQVKSTQAVQDAVRRLAAAGLPTSVEEKTNCCFAVQDKVWVTDPDGNQWEVFVVLEADADLPQEASAACCTSAADEPKHSCC